VAPYHLSLPEVAQDLAFIRDFFGQAGIEPCCVVGAYSRSYLHGQADEDYVFSVETWIRKTFSGTPQQEDAPAEAVSSPACSGWRRAAERLFGIFKAVPRPPRETLAAFVRKAMTGRQVVVTLETDLLEDKDLRDLLVGCRNEISIGRRPGTLTYKFRQEAEATASQLFGEGFDFIGHTHPPDRYGVLRRFLPSDADLYASCGHRFFILSAIGVTWYRAPEDIILDQEAYKDYVVSAETGRKSARRIAQEMRERFDVEVEIIPDLPGFSDEFSSPAERSVPAARAIRITEETLEDIEQHAAATVNSATEMHGLIMAAGAATKLFALPEKQLEAEGRLNRIERYLQLRAMFAGRLRAWIEDRGLDETALAPVADIHTHSRRHYLRYTSAFGKPLEKKQAFPVSYAVSPSGDDLYYWGVLMRHSFGVYGLSLGAEDKDYFRKICVDVLQREYGRKIDGGIPVAIAALVRGELVVGAYRPVCGASYDENKDRCSSSFQRQVHWSSGENPCRGAHGLFMRGSVRRKRGRQGIGPGFCCVYRRLPQSGSRVVPGAKYHRGSDFSAERHTMASC
jgi:hypothetical protein